MTTPLEAYLTGVVTMALMDVKTLALQVVPVTESGQINGVIELHTATGEVRASVVITEHVV